MKTIFCWAIAITMFAHFVAYAQERAAGGAVETQMTWTALSNQIDTLKAQMTGLDSKVTVINGKVTTIDDKVARLMACASSGKLYAPGTSGVDANGCKDVSGGNRWVASGSASVQSFSRDSLSSYRNKLANAGYAVCASSLRDGAKCPTANVQCVVISSYSDTCSGSGASDGDSRPCTRYGNTIYRCD